MDTETEKLELEGYPKGRKKGGVVKRARGGGLNKDEAVEEREDEAESREEHKMAVPRKKGGKLPKAFVEEEDGKKKRERRPHEARKHGGMVDGKMPMGRPDKRARGGVITSDESPLTSAGKMSSMPYENKEAPEDEHGEGRDRG
jgi:hypothetical protein